MKWTDGHVSVVHPRVQWSPGCCASVYVHCKIEELKGTAAKFGARASTLKTEYESAKYKFNKDAAFNIIDRCVRENILDDIVDILCGEKNDVILIAPHPSFDDEDGSVIGPSTGYRPTNAIPFAFTAYLGQVLGCEVDSEIIQSARVGRTKLNTFLRYLCQPSFIGTVRQDAAYILVDDVITTGGTLAALRSYIVGNGGKVIGATAVASSRGETQPFAILPETINMLEYEYGRDISLFWKGVTGHEIQSLTEAEARHLVQWSEDTRSTTGCERGTEALQHLRNRIDEAASKGC